MGHNTSKAPTGHRNRSEAPTRDRMYPNMNVIKYQTDDDSAAYHHNGKDDWLILEYFLRVQLAWNDGAY